MNTIVEAFIYCVLCHYVADYVLQTSFVAKFKCKSTWVRECPLDLYKNDYKAVLLSHCVSWSIVTFLPLFWLINRSSVVFLCTIIANTIVHYITDDAKANKIKISLRTDQLIHMAQIVLTTIAYAFL